MSPVKVFREDPGLGRRRRGIVALMVAAVAAALLPLSLWQSIPGLLARTSEKQ